MAIFGQNHGLTTLQKCQFFDLQNFLLLQPIKTFFRQKIVKDIFLAYIAPKKSIWKNGHFLNQNHGLTPLKKCQFFNFLNCFFYSLKRLFFGLKCRKRNFPFLYCQKNKKQNLEKYPFLNQKNGLTPLEKCQFFDFLNFLFLQPREAFFPFRIS